MSPLVIQTWPLFKISCASNAQSHCKEIAHLHSLSLLLFLLASIPMPIRETSVSRVHLTHKKQTKARDQVCLLVVSLFWLIRTLIPSRWQTTLIFSGLTSFLGLKTFSFKTETVPGKGRPLVTLSQLGRSGFWPSWDLCQLSVRKLPWIHDFQSNHLKSVLYEVRFLATRGQNSNLICFALTPMYHF